MLGTFSQEATNLVSFTAMMAGGFAYRLGKMGVLSIGLGRNLPFLSRLLAPAAGLASEVTAFQGSQRIFETLQRHPSPLFSAPGSEGFWEGWRNSFVDFGMMKGVSHLLQHHNFLWQHLSQAISMVAGHQATASLGWTSACQGSIEEQLFHAEITNIQWGAGATLFALASGHRLHQLERSLEQSANFHTALPAERNSLFSGLAHGPVFSAGRTNFARLESLPEDFSRRNIDEREEGPFRSEGEGKPPRPSSPLSFLGKIRDLSRKLNSVDGGAIPTLMEEVYYPLMDLLDEERGQTEALQRREVLEELFQVMARLRGFEGESANITFTLLLRLARLHSFSVPRFHKEVLSFVEANWTNANLQIRVLRQLLEDEAFRKGTVGEAFAFAIFNCRADPIQKRPVISFLRNSDFPLHIRKKAQALSYHLGRRSKMDGLAELSVLAGISLFTGLIVADHALFHDFLAHASLEGLSSLGKSFMSVATLLPGALASALGRENVGRREIENEMRAGAQTSVFLKEALASYEDPSFVSDLAPNLDRLYWRILEHARRGILPFERARQILIKILLEDLIQKVERKGAYIERITLSEFVAGLRSTPLWLQHYLHQSPSAGKLRVVNLSANNFFHPRDLEFALANTGLIEERMGFEPGTLSNYSDPYAHPCFYILPEGLHEAFERSPHHISKMMGKIPIAHNASLDEVLKMRDQDAWPDFLGRSREVIHSMKAHPWVQNYHDKFHRYVLGGFSLEFRQDLVSIARSALKLLPILRKRISEEQFVAASEGLFNRKEKYEEVLGNLIGVYGFRVLSLASDEFVEAFEREIFLVFDSSHPRGEIVRNAWQNVRFDWRTRTEVI